MDRPCLTKIVCPGPTPGLEADSPVINYSSEYTDGAEFTSRQFVYVDPYDPLIPGWWVASACAGLFECTSFESQDDADLCAARFADICRYTPPPPFPDGGNECDYDPEGCTPPQLELFYNTQQTCTFPCPDGSTTFSWTIPAGSFVALSQELADRLAVVRACQLVASRVMCMSKLATLPCANQAWSATVAITGTNIPYRFSVIGGTLPPGIGFRQVNNNTAQFYGLCPTPGHYFVTILAVSRDGWTFSKTYDIGVLGVTNDQTLPDATIGIAYSEQLTADGGTAPYTFALESGSLPDGLSLASDGLITGTPTTDEFASFRVTVTDSST